ncbi:MAG: hypothetical protein Kow00120_15220 [Anaerolineae bacterium]
MNPFARQRRAVLGQLDALYARMARNRAEAARLRVQEARAVRERQAALRRR